jgi:hypothetical protein
LHLDWSEQWGAYICRRGLRPPPDDWNSCRTAGIVRAHAWCRVGPCTEFVLDDVEEEEKVFHLCHHSKELAIAFGLINTALSTPLRIRKNPRVCKDCHTSIKFISKIVGRANHHGEGCQSLSSLWRWCLLLHGLLVMPVVWLVKH